MNVKSYYVGNVMEAPMSFENRARFQEDILFIFDGFFLGPEIRRCVVPPHVENVYRHVFFRNKRECVPAYSYFRICCGVSYVSLVIGEPARHLPAEYDLEPVFESVFDDVGQYKCKRKRHGGCSPFLSRPE